MKRDHLSTHHSFDDPSYWQFQRNSGLPRSAFREPRDPDRIVLIACVALALGVGLGLYFGFI